MPRRYYPVIDLLKLSFALCILALHRNALYGLRVGPDLERLLFRPAVPFFFAASGFFLRRKCLKAGSPGTATRMYVHRLLTPLMVFGSLNTLLAVREMLRAGLTTGAILEDVLRHLLFSPYGALWYLLASIVGAVLLLPFLRRNRLNAALLLGALLYAVALLLNSYWFLVEGLPRVSAIIGWYMRTFISARNGVFVGFFFLGLGMKCWDIHAARAPKFRSLCPLLVLACALYAAEVLALRTRAYLDDGALFITHILLIPSLLLTAAACPLKLPERWSVLARNLSTGIYLLHRAILSLLPTGGSYGTFVLTPALATLLTLGCCVAACLLTYRSRNQFVSKLLR